MTMPHLSNCPHSDEGWCLSCVGELISLKDEEAKEEMVRTHFKAIDYKHALNQIDAVVAGVIGRPREQRMTEALREINAAAYRLEPADEGDSWEHAYDKLWDVIREQIAMVDKK